MLVFTVLLVIPLLVAVASFVFLRGITWKEFLVQVGTQVLVAAISATCVYCANTTDVEVWNGRVTNKRQTWVPCSHSYQCNCRQVCTGSGKDRSCSTVCDTCYEHTNDYDWNVYTSNGEVITIARIDSQGVSEPSRWTAVRLGEPTAVPHKYTSYIKAAPDTLFRRQGTSSKYKGHIPAYPGQVYDYYRLNRFVSHGVPADAAAWNAALSDLAADLGSARQANVIVVLTTQPHDWFHALEEEWVGGKKNDIVLVVGVDAAGKPVWADVMAWTIDPLFKVKLRDDILDDGTLDPKSVASIIRRNTLEHHRRKPMADYEYLKASITPSPTEWVVTLVIGLVVAAGLAWFMHTYDLFNEERRAPWARGYRGRRGGLFGAPPRVNPWK